MRQANKVKGYIGGIYEEGKEAGAQQAHRASPHTSARKELFLSSVFILWLKQQLVTRTEERRNRFWPPDGRGRL